nr:pyridoxamine 5'-phosphate oxidase family protein [Kordiimonas laminariae]
MEELQTLYGQPAQASLDKETDHLTDTYKKWLEHAPFYAFSSQGDDFLDCSPRGDKQGELFKIADPKTIMLPDRRGNNRIDTLRNIIKNPNVALLFLIPGVGETLRIKGKATITADPKLLENFSENGKPPKTVIIVKIDKVYFQCARAIKRSALWEKVPEDNLDTVPTAGQMIKATDQSFDAESYDAILPKRQAETLY